MSNNANLEDLFQKYFFETEGFALRAERFYDDYTNSFNNGTYNPTIMVKWLQAAFYAGAEAMEKANEGRN